MVLQKSSFADWYVFYKMVLLSLPEEKIVSGTIHSCSFKLNPIDIG